VYRPLDNITSQSSTLTVAAHEVTSSRIQITLGSSHSFWVSKIISSVPMLHIHYHHTCPWLPLQCISSPAHHIPASPHQPITSVLYHSHPFSPNLSHLIFSRFLQWNLGGISTSQRAELLSFLSSKRYDIVLLQETNLSSSWSFKVPGFSSLELMDLHQPGLALVGNQNGGLVFSHFD